MDCSEYHTFGIPASDFSWFVRWIPEFGRNLMLKFRGKTAFYPEDQTASSSEIRLACTYLLMWHCSPENRSLEIINCIRNSLIKYGIGIHGAQV